MGFLSTMKSHGTSGNKAIGAKFTKKVTARDEDTDKVVECTITIKSIVIDTSRDGILEDCVHGGSIKAGEHGTVTYKSEAGDKLAEAASEVFDSDIAEAPKRRRRGRQADTVNPENNGHAAPSAS